MRQRYNAAKAYQDRDDSFIVVDHGITGIELLHFLRIGEVPSAFRKLCVPTKKRGRRGIAEFRYECDAAKVAYALEIMHQAEGVCKKDNEN